MENGTPLGEGGRPTQVLTQSHDMEELRPDLLPVSSSTASAGTFDSSPSSTTTITTTPSNGSVVGGGGTVVGSGLSVISTAVPSQQPQQLVRLSPPPSKGAVPLGVTLAPSLH